MNYLSRALAWTSQQEFIRTFHEAHLRSLREAVAFWATAVRRIEPALADAVDDVLATAAYRRFVGAPETYRRLVDSVPSRSAETRAFVRNAITAERRVTGQLRTSRSAVWTAVGDAYFPARVTRDNPVYHAPLAADWLVVDGFSPFARFNTSHASSSLTDYPPADFACVARRLDDSLRRMAAAHPAAWQMMRLVCRVIVVQKDVTHARQFASSSDRSYAGRIALANPHLDALPTERLVSALVHESIHSMLFVFESVRPFFHVHTLPEHARISSPWTGRPLQVTAYVHACLVWYGLRNFWRDVRVSQIFSEAAVAKQIKDAESGFHREPLEHRLGRLRHQLAPYVRESLAEIQETVLQDRSHTEGMSQPPVKSLERRPHDRQNIKRSLSPPSPAD